MALLAESSPNSKRRYDVFLSFKGEDSACWNLASELYAALWNRGVVTFKFDEGIKGEEGTSLTRLKAIEDSQFAIVIFSKKFGSCTRFLDELQKIVDPEKELGQKVFPIFYGVDPSDIQLGESFGNEKRFIKSENEVQRWRKFLTAVANLPGWTSKDGYKTDLIENIVREICNRLFYNQPSYDNSHLVGINSRMVELISSLVSWEDDVHFVGIWGMGGIGKTTLATIVYERISRQFEICCFLANVRETSERFGDIHLQRMFLSHLNIKNMVVYDTDEGRELIKDLFGSKKVLLVLDDVISTSQLENLACSKEWFGAGSRIIITTRDKGLLTKPNIHAIYKAKFLDNYESLQLLSKKAFKKDTPEESYLELSMSIVRYAGGLPLALQVLGSFLCGRSKSEWIHALNKSEEYENMDIFDTLQISYDELKDNEKAIFLDIACFFNRWEKDKVIHVLKNCGVHPTIEIGLRLLIEKSLIIEKGKYLEMHDILQDLGRSIALQESPDRSRLWSLEDIDKVLTENMETAAIQGMVLRFNEPYEAYWNPEAFSNMRNLRLLIVSSDDHWSQPFNEMKLPNGLKCLPRALKVVQWWGYPLEALPLKTPLHELVDVSMPYSKIKHLWDGIQGLSMLKFIDLSHSKYLTETPNFVGVPNLERLILEGCISLVKVHPSLGELKKVAIVNLRNCKTLKILPRKLEMNSLMELVLAGCSKIAKLPEFGRSMKDLFSIDLQDTIITELPESLEFLTGLRDLNLNDCKNLVCLPHTFHNLKHLRNLTLSGCLEFSKLPENLNENEALENLDVSATSIKEVPLSIFQLRNLKAISYDGCKLSASNSWSLSHILWKSFGRHPIPVWLWRIVGLLSCLIAEVSYGLSSSFKHLWKEWKWWKILVYTLLSFIICSIVLFMRRARQGWKTVLMKAHVAFVILMSSSLYSYYYDKSMSGKSNAFDLISSGAFALMSLSLSRLSDPGYEAGVFSFLLGFLTQQLMKNHFILVLVAAGVCYFFILFRCCLDAHFQPHTEIARVQVQCTINSVDVDLENQGADDQENQGADDQENQGADDQENESEDLENEFVDPENEVCPNPNREIERDYQVQPEIETARIQQQHECKVNIVVDPENEASLNQIRKRKRESQVQAETETERVQDQCVINIVNTQQESKRSCS